MPTFLETLAERETIAERTQLALLELDQRNLRALQRRAEVHQLHEDAWASSDPFTTSGASVAGLGSAVNDLHQYGAIGRHSARPGSRRHGAQPPYYWTEPQHWQQVESARVVEAFCVTAKNMLEVLKQFIIFTGFAYTIVARKKPGEQPAPSPDDQDQDGPALADPPEPKANPLVDATQEFLDKWMKTNKWHKWEKELVNRTERDGESLTVIELDQKSDDFLRITTREPEQLRDPISMTGILNSKLGISGRDADWRFGILTTKDDTSRPLAYNFVSQHNDSERQHEIFDADEVHHIKANVDGATKRGISVFFQIFNALPRVKKLLRALSESAVVQANVAWIEELPPGMGSGGLPEAVGGENVTTRTGRQAAARFFDGPEALTVTAGHKYTAGPLAGTGQSETLISTLQAALRNIGSLKQFPEGLVSGDASNANLASALVAEAPFVRARECEQKFYRDEFLEIIERVIDAAAIAGLLGPARENIFDDIEVSVEMPPVVPRKAKEETERNSVLNERGILSNQTWSSREDLDFDDEQQLIAEDPIEPPMMMLGIDAEAELAAGEAEDDTDSETSTSTDSESGGGNQRRRRGLGPKGAKGVTGATGTNRERERVS
jgi:hypothetical protein